MTLPAIRGEQNAVTVDRLSYSYGGRVALSDVTFTVAEGQFFCVLGPNGAGKSTTVKVLTGRLPYRKGNVTVLGSDVKLNPILVRNNVGILTDDMAIPDDFTVEELLVFAGRSFSQSKRTAWETAQRIMGETGLLGERTTRIRRLSTGLRRRAEIAQALVNDARVLFLDEPTANLDPHSSREIRDLIKMIHGQGVTIVYTTHLLNEVEDLCTDLVVLDRGQVRVHSSVGSLRQRARCQIRIEVRDRGDLQRAVAVLGAQQMPVCANDGVLVILSREKKLLDSVLDQLTANNIKITSAAFLTETLADLYSRALNQPFNAISSTPAHQSKSAPNTILGEP